MTKQKLAILSVSAGTERISTTEGPGEHRMKSAILAKFLFLFTLATLSVGCAAGRGFEFRKPESYDTGIIYLYRPFVWEGLPASPVILLNDVPQGNLRTRGYMDFDVKPGLYMIETKGNNRSWTTKESIGVNVTGGSVVFIKLEMKDDEIQSIDLHSGQKTGHLKPKLKRMNRTRGLKEIAGARRCGPK